MYLLQLLFESTALRQYICLHAATHDSIEITNAKAGGSGVVASITVSSSRAALNNLFARESSDGSSLSNFLVRLAFRPSGWDPKEPHARAGGRNVSEP
jgi:hypothetical protein